MDNETEPPASRASNHNDGYQNQPSVRQNSNRRSGGRRSKSRSKKPPNDMKRIDTTAKALGIEINSTLDRISELDAQNELLMLENQKLKDEIIQMQDDKKQLNKKVEKADDKLRGMEKLQREQDATLAEVREEALIKDDEIEKYAKQAKRLADLNEELRMLFEEERKAMAEESDRLEDEVEQIHHQHNRKLEMIKGKLYLLLSALSLGKQLKVDRDSVTLDQLFKEL